MTEPINPRTTLAEVATRARVSLATASKVANARPDVSDHTRERVERAIEDLGYSPPRRRSSGARESVAFLIDVINSTYAMEIMRGAVLACEALGFDLVVERLHQKDELRSGLTSTALTQRLLAAERIGAVALTAGLPEAVYADVLKARLPMVMIDPLDSTYPDAHSVGATNWLGGRSAAEHLIGLGHRRLGVLSGPPHSLSAMARLDGFLSACSQAGVQVPETHIKSALFATHEARRATREWFQSLERPPSAVMAGSDAQAMGVLQAAHDCSITVPDQLSVVCYDDTALAAAATPPLTAVHQPLAEMGRRAVEMVLDLHKGNRDSSHHIELATRLVVRDSTAAPASS